MAPKPQPEWHRRLVCSGCGGREVDFVLTGARRRRTPGDGSDPEAEPDRQVSTSQSGLWLDATDQRARSWGEGGIVTGLQSCPIIGLSLVGVGNQTADTF